MLLLKQLRCLNLNGVRKLNVTMHQITNPNRIATISAQSLSRIEQFEAYSVSNALCFNPPSLLLTRSYSRNDKDHLSKIVRPYTKTPFWLTDLDRRINILYSFIFLIPFAIIGFLCYYFNFKLGGERGLDINRIQKYVNNDKK